MSNPSWLGGGDSNLLAVDGAPEQLLQSRNMLRSSSPSRMDPVSFNFHGRSVVVPLNVEDQTEPAASGSHQDIYDPVVAAFYDADDAHMRNPATTPKRSLHHSFGGLMGSAVAGMEKKLFHLLPGRWEETTQTGRSGEVPFDGEVQTERATWRSHLDIDDPVVATFYDDTGDSHVRNPATTPKRSLHHLFMGDFERLSWPEPGACHVDSTDTQEMYDNFGNPMHTALEALPDDFVAPSPPSLRRTVRKNVVGVMESTVPGLERKLFDLFPNRLEEKIQKGRSRLAPLVSLRQRMQELYAEKCNRAVSQGIHPADALLADGFEVLLTQVTELVGAANFPAVMVSFKELTFRVKIDQRPSVTPTYASKLLELVTIWLRCRPHRVEVEMLKGLTGSFRPGTTTLLLGPPQAGKSTLLKVLAGQVPSKDLHGFVAFAGRNLLNRSAQGEVHLHKVVGYIPQLDLHFPTLTVRETVDLARGWTCHISHKFLRKATCLKEFALFMEVEKLATEVLLSMLGIRKSADTICGSETLRGISGGQKRRLTTAEVLVTGTPVVLADQISNGLDSATTYEICSSLRAAARVMRRTVVVSLLQATPETFGCFDRVLVMCGGQIAYHGPRHLALKYFSQLGFHCPKDMDAADFLQEVTMPHAFEKFGGPTQSTPWDPDDFGREWLNSPLAREEFLEDEAALLNSQEALDAMPRGEYAYQRLSTKHTAPLHVATSLCLKREVKLLWRNKWMIWVPLIQMLLAGLLVGSLYLQIGFADTNGKFAVIYFISWFPASVAYPILPSIQNMRPIIYRQLNAQFYGVVPYAIAVSIADVPNTIFQCTVLVVIVYFMCGFTYTFSNFLLFLVMVCLTRMGLCMMYKVIAVLMPNDVSASGFALVVELVFSSLSGYLIAQRNIPPWLIWVYWIDPMQYQMTALSQLEFLRSERYQAPLDPANMALGTSGEAFLTAKRISTESTRFWTGYVFNAGFYILMATLFAFILRFLKWRDRFPPPPPEAITTDHTTTEMPFTPCTVAWEDVTYDVNDPSQKGSKSKLALRLLNGVSGFATPGTLTAIMGTSGAGKTTLLDVLAGRKNTGRIGGRILLNGQEVDPITFSHCTGYVEQMDIHSPQATVTEALRFSAYLRLPREVPSNQKEAFVWKVIQLLQLQKQANSLIGTKTKGLSLEQVKRVTIGVELAANPAAIFLDEPTTGLDSLNAVRIVDAMKHVAATQRAIICTIHQPSPQVFSMFDSLLLLVRGGRTAFFGKVGTNGADIIRYFSCVQTQYPYDGLQNPATWMLTAVQAHGVDIPEAYRASDLCSANVQGLRQASAPQAKLDRKHRYQAPLWTQFQCLLLKWARVHWRCTEYNLTRTGFSVLIALVLGLMYWQLNPTDQQSIFSAVGAIYQSWGLMGSLCFYSVLGIMERERTVYYREKAVHMYHPILFSLVTGLCEIPYVLLNTLLHVSIFYWMAGLKAELGAFLFFWFTIWLYGLFSTTFGILLAYLLPSAEIASAVGAMCMLAMSLTNGFVQPVYLIGWWWRWLYYMFPLSYMLQNLVSSQFYCAQVEATPNQPGLCPTIQVDTVGGIEMVSQWTFLKEYFDLHNERRWMYVGVIICAIAVCHAFSSAAVAFVHHDRR